VSFLESGLTFVLTVKPDSRKDTVSEKDRLDLNRKPPPIGYHLPILGF